MAYSTTLATLVQRTRRFVRDWPDFDSLTASVASDTTTITVADTSIYGQRWPIEVDDETMIIRSLSTATVLVVERGAYGSTAATHANGADVLVRPSFYRAEIVDAINQAILGTWPYFYLPITDTSLNTLDSTYEYTIPNVSSSYAGNTIQIPAIYSVMLKYPGDLTYRESRRWFIVKGTTRLLKFRSAEPAGASIRIMGFSPFPALVNDSDPLHALFPPQGEYILPMGATAYLLMSGEAGRTRFDTGATDTRESANRIGSSMSAGLQLQQRFMQELLKVAMPPLPRHTRMVL